MLRQWNKQLFEMPYVIEVYEAFGSHARFTVAAWAMLLKMCILTRGEREQKKQIPVSIAYSKHRARISSKTESYTRGLSPSSKQECVPQIAETLRPNDLGAF